MPNKMTLYERNEKLIDDFKEKERSALLEHSKMKHNNKDFD